MKLFISHAFEDEAEFDNLTSALDNVGIAHWNPEAVRAGSSLRHQLREALRSCELCIFIATRNSINSGWCLAELGAFWGASKSVIAYLADQSLHEDELPKHLHGDVWDRKIRRIVEAAQSAFNDMEKESAVRSEAPERARVVANMTIKELEDIIASSVRRAQLSPSVSSALVRLADLLSSFPKSSEAPADAVSRIGTILNALIGLSRDDLKSLDFGPWLYRIFLTSLLGSPPGDWEGYALEQQEATDIEIYRGCILLQFQQDLIVSAMVVSQVVEDSRGKVRPEVRWSKPLAYAGREALSESANPALHRTANALRASSPGEL